MERPIGFQSPSRWRDDLKAIVADGIVSASPSRLGRDSWGHRLDYILTNSVRALLDVPGATLLMLPRLLIDEGFRARIVEQHVADPIVHSFWVNEYAGYSTSFRTEAIAPIQNKIGKVLMVPSLRNSWRSRAARSPSAAWRTRAPSSSAIYRKAVLGESTAHLLGALLTTAVAQAALSRANTPASERSVFHFYADEFQSLATDSFGLILSEARKYGLTLTLAHQYLNQLPDQLRSAVFGNAGSIVACRSGAEDAATLAAQIGLHNSEALLDLPNFSAWARLLQRGAPTSPIRFELYDAPPVRRPDAYRLIDISRQRFGRPRREVEARIRRFLAG